MDARFCFVVTCFCIIAYLLLLGVNAFEGYFYPSNHTGGTADSNVVTHQFDNSSVILDFVPLKLNSTKDLQAKEKFEYMIRTNEVTDGKNPSSLKEKCISEHMTFGCCYKFPEVDFLVCVNITYLPDVYGLNFTLLIGEAVFSEEVSLRNPPPLCLDTKMIFPEYRIGALCIKIHDIDVTKSHVHFCARLFIRFLVKSIYSKEIGCVEIPVSKKTLISP